jgi:hypothetical protein
MYMRGDRALLILAVPLYAGVFADHKRGGIVNHSEAWPPTSDTAVDFTFAPAGGQLF